MSIKLKGSSDGSVSFDAPADTSPSGSDITLVLPTTVGSAEQFLKNSGTAGTLEFSSMVETSTGVGIGTSSPSAKLHANSGSTDVVADFESGDANAWIQIRDNSTTDTAVMVGAVGDDMRLRAGSNERVRINSSGYVGIGTTSPVRGLHLATSGNNNVYFHLTHDGTGHTNNDGADIRLNRSTDTLDIMNLENQGITFHTNGENERLRIDSSGNVGIGTTSPTSYGNSQATLVIEDDTNPAICWSDTGQTRDWWAVANGSNLSFNYADGGGSGSASNVTNALSMANSGNVGIGNSSPSRKLHIHDGSGSSAQVVQIDAGGVGLLSIQSGTTSESRIEFGDSSNDDAGYIYYHNNDDVMKFGVNGSERMRIDSDGRLLLGSTSSIGGDAIFQVQTTGNRKAHFHQPDSGGSIVQFTNTTTGTGTSDGFEVALNGSEDGQVWLYESGNIKFGTANSERMRITSGGTLMVGTTGSNNPGVEIYKESNAIGRIDVYKTYSGTANALACFHSGSYVGGVQYANSSTSFQTSSDARLKENISNIDGAITRIKQLSPKRFNFIIEPDVIVDGFLAHEAQTVVPEAVSGTHNEVDADGNPVYQGIDQSKLVPLLTAALQEAIAKIETLETKVAALEAQ